MNSAPCSWFPRSCVVTHTSRSPSAILCISTQERGNELKSSPNLSPNSSEKRAPAFLCVFAPWRDHNCEKSLEPLGELR